MSEDSLVSDYRWLVSSEGDRYLARAARHEGSTLALAKILRRDLSARRGHLVLEQLELRQRAQAKFSAADQLFFTRQALEQATDEAIADYKAGRFEGGAPVADLCCGIGGDLMSLARRGPVVGVDADPVAVLLATENCDRLGLTQAEVEATDVEHCNLDPCHAWHIDPDRRPGGHRTTKLDYSSPNLETIQRLAESRSSFAVKLAPAATIPDDWAARAEVEWIGSGRECKQQVAWFGTLATRPRCRVTTVLSRHGRSQFSADSACLESAPIADSVMRYVYEPHAAMLAAGLGPAFGHDHDLFRVSRECGYLTGDHWVPDSILSAFEVVEALPFDQRRIKSALRNLDAGQVEVKARGDKYDSAGLQKALRGKGRVEAVVLVARREEKTLAIVATRTHGPDGAGTTNTQNHSV